MPAHQKIEYCLVFFLLTIILFSSMVSTPFHVDEAQWLGTSVYLESFLHLDFNNSIWEPHYWTMNSPPLTRYVVGAGRLLAGIPASEVSCLAYDYALSVEENQAAGVVPSARLLLAGRVPMVVITLFSSMFFYVLLRKSFPFPAGLIFIALLLLNSMLRARLLSAMSESLLLGTFLMICWAAQKTQTQVLRFLEGSGDTKNRNQIYLWMGITGALVGLSAACKIYAFSIGFIFPVLLIYWFYFMRNALPQDQKLSWCVRFFTVFVLASLAVFILVNPFLYHNPLLRTGMLLKWRLEEMTFHIENYPESIIPGNLLQRWCFIFKKTLTDYAAIRFAGSFWINFSLFLIGSLFILQKLVKEWENKAGFSIFVTISLLAVPMTLCALMSPLDWPRFFLFPVFFSTVNIAVGGSELWVFKWIQRFGGKAVGYQSRKV